MLPEDDQGYWSNVIQWNYSILSHLAIWGNFMLVGTLSETLGSATNGNFNYIMLVLGTYVFGINVLFKKVCDAPWNE